MTTRTALVAAVALFALAGCRGPKGSPDSSVKSFFSAAAARDWDSMNETISKASRQKLGSNYEKYFRQSFGGWRDIDVTIDDYTIDSDGKTATVRFTCVAAQLENYKESYFDCSDAFTVVKEEDGKWHVNLPSRQSLRPM